MFAMHDIIYYNDNNKLNIVNANHQVKSLYDIYGFPVKFINGDIWCGDLNKHKNYTKLYTLTNLTREKSYKLSFPQHHDYTIRGNMIAYIGRERYKDLLDDVVEVISGNARKVFRMRDYMNVFEVDNHALNVIKEKGVSCEGGNIDWCHLNSIEFISDNELLLSSRQLSTIFVLNIDTGKIEWRCSALRDGSLLMGQHAPTLLSNGNILLFDNGGISGKYCNLQRDYSRILEINPNDNSTTVEIRCDNYSPFMSNVVKVNDGYVVLFGTLGLIQKFDFNGNVVWEHQVVDSNGNNKGIYRIGVLSNEEYEEAIL